MGAPIPPMGIFKTGIISSPGTVSLCITGLQLVVLAGPSNRRLHSSLPELRCKASAELEAQWRKLLATYNSLLVAFLLLPHVDLVKAAGLLYFREVLGELGIALCELLSRKRLDPGPVDGDALLDLAYRL